MSARYAFIQEQPLYGFDEDRREVSLGGSVRLHENWRVFGSGTYDFEKSVVVQNSAGFAYDDECFTYLMTFSETRDRDTEEVSQSIGFNLSFRTLGDFGSATDSSSLSELLITMAFLRTVIEFHMYVRPGCFPKTGRRLPGSCSSRHSFAV